MSHDVVVSLSEDVFQALASDAALSGEPIPEHASKLLTASLRQEVIGPNVDAEKTAEQIEDSHQRFMAHFGTVHAKGPLNLDNNTIDADLARAYDNAVEDK
jgi:hypothetical protein